MKRPDTPLRAAVVAVLASFVFSPFPAAAAPGDPDLTFNGTGFVRHGFLGAPNTAYGTAGQADGRIVVAGACFNGDSWDFCVVRYNTDGSLDPAFGVGGRVITGFGAGSYDIAKCVAIQADGRIVVGGDANSQFALARYNTDGSLDASFDGDGRAIAGSAGFCQGNGITLQPDGGIVLVGSRVTDDTHFAAVRFLSTGSVDLPFGGDGTGIVTTPLLVRDVANGVTLQSDLKIVAVGTATNEIGANAIAVIRYNTNGSPDNSFHGDGSTINTIGFRSEGYGIAVQTSITSPDKIVVAGTAEETGTEFNFLLARFNIDGTPDATFDGDGFLTTDFVSGYDVARGVAVQYSGATPTRIVAGGFASPSGDIDFGAARYFLGGALDGAFDGDGRATVSVDPVNDEVALGMTRVSGRLVLVGEMYVGNQNAVVVRLNDDGSPDATFDGDGIRVEDAGFRTADARGVTIQSDGKIVAAGTVSFPDIPNFAVFRCHPDGSPDLSWNGTGVVETDYIGADEQGAAVAQAPDGKIVVAGTRITEPPDSAIMIVRYNADGTPDMSFGDGGVVTHIPEGLATVVEDMLILPDGRILVAGWTASSQIPFPFMVLTRYEADGDPDVTWGNFGLVTIGIGSGSWAKAIALQPDNGVVVTGYTRQGSFDELVTVDLNSSGFFDAGFGGGWVITSMTPGHDQATDVVLVPGGKILVGGRADTGAADDLVLVRYLADGSLDATFDMDGKVLTAISPTYRGLSALALQPNGKVVTAGQRFTAPTRFDLLLARYNPDGSIDNTYGTAGQAQFDVSAGNHDLSRELVLDSMGRAVVAGYSGGLFLIGRILGDDIVSAVGDRAAAPSFRVGLPYPNPMRAGTTISLELPAAGNVSATVVDVSGRLVRTLAEESLFPAGTHPLSWDGRDGTGARAGAGIYFLRVRLGDAVIGRSLMVLGGPD